VLLGAMLARLALRLVWLQQAGLRVPLEVFALEQLTTPKDQNRPSTMRSV
jgi:hypothetical protein